MTEQILWSTRKCSADHANTGGTAVYSKHKPQLTVFLSSGPDCFADPNIPAVEAVDVCLLRLPVITGEWTHMGISPQFLDFS